jgi:hypothetical protein
MTVISLEEFAEKCGKSPRQVRRYIADGLIQAVRGKHGYTIPLEELAKLRTSGPASDGRPADTSRAGVRTGDMADGRTASADMSTTEMALAGLRTAQEQTALVLDQLRVAQELRERAERQLELVRGEYRLAQLALTESAESLSQREALWRQSEAELKQHNEQQMALWEAEKANLVKDLETSRKRVDWLEKRVPRWVRGLFGAK